MKESYQKQPTSTDLMRCNIQFYPYAEILLLHFLYIVLIVYALARVCSSLVY